MAIGKKPDLFIQLARVGELAFFFRLIPAVPGATLLAFTFDLHLSFTTIDLTSSDKSLSISSKQDAVGHPIRTLRHHDFLASRGSKANHAGMPRAGGPYA